jgi:hypothetical protein
MEAVLIFSFVIIGVVIVAAASYIKVDFGEISKTSIILLPLLAYLIATGKVGEFEGFGLKAKFAVIASSKIVEPARLADLVISSDESNNPNFLVDMINRPCRPYYVIRDKFLPELPSEEEKQIIKHIAQQIRRSLLCGAFKALVVVDDRLHPIGIIEADALQEILRVKLTARNILLVSPGISVISSDPFSEIIATELGLALTNPRFQAESDLAKRVIVNSDASVEQTYNDILAAAANVAAITDRRGRFLGIVTRDAIQSWIISHIISARDIR